MTVGRPSLAGAVIFSANQRVAEVVVDVDWAYMALMLSWHTIMFSQRAAGPSRLLINLGLGKNLFLKIHSEAQAVTYFKKTEALLSLTFYVVCFMYV